MNIRRTDILVCICIVSSICWGQYPESQRTFTGDLYTNEEFIGGLYNDTLDLGDSLTVFKYVIAKLPENVVVYPIENYYYFIFTASGRVFWGSISLFPSERNSGRVGFGYVEKGDKYKPIDRDASGGWGSFGVEHGVHVEKLDEFTYSIGVGGKTVRFHFHDQAMSFPLKARILPDEVYIGPNFDESGLRFFLLYNRSYKKFYWILNEDEYVPEHFREYTSEILIGDRTDFAFYNDHLNGRKILIGVEGYNVLQNNWYDGPFDQLPDNHILSGEVELKGYIEEAYPKTRGAIDQFGNYLDDSGTRVAISPYLVYFSKKELQENLRACKEECESSSEFYSCITQQVFIIPENVWERDSVPSDADR